MKRFPIQMQILVTSLIDPSIDDVLVMINKIEWIYAHIISPVDINESLEMMKSYIQKSVVLD